MNDTQGSYSLSNEELVAVREVTKFVSSSATGIKAYNSIPNFMGGTVICVAFKDPDEHHVLVLVRGNNGQIFSQWENLLALVPGYRPSLLQALSAPQLIIAILSLLIVCATFGMSIWHGFGDNTVPEPFRSALAGVLGYWLGQTKNRDL